MAYHDSNMELLSKCCEGCRLSDISNKLDTLVYDLDSGVGYSGALLSTAEVAYLDGMCMATAGLGTILNGILTASQEYDVATQISDEVKASLNNCCVAFSTNSVGDVIAACVTLINAMQEYDESFINSLYFTGLSDYPATIDDEEETILVELPYGTAKTALVANFTTSTGASVLNGESVLTSGTGAIDYTNPVTLTCLSHDESTSLDYVTTVTILANTASDFLTFVLAGANGVIDTELATIAVETPFGTNLSSLAPTFTVSAQATVFVASAEQTSAVTLQDFSSAIVYRVVAGDESYTDYTITATVAEA